MSLNVESSDRPILVASDRGPAIFTHDADGNLKATRGKGGLVTALSPLAESENVTWIFSGTSEGLRSAVDPTTGEVRLPNPPGVRARLVPVPLSPTVYDPFYETASTVLWLLHHRMAATESASGFIDAWTDGYVQVNQAFAQAIESEIQSSDSDPVVLIHDLHLFLLPQLVRNRIPNSRILHFTHPPWPAPKTWSMIPEDVVRQILESLLTSDIVGLQTQRDVSRFLDCCDQLLPDSEVDRSAQTVIRRGRLTRVRSYPVAVDLDDMKGLASSSEVQTHRQRLEQLRTESLIVRIDRVDPIKNVPAGFRAFQRMLELHPELQGKVTFLAFLVPDTSDIPEYVRCRREIEREASVANDQFATDDWTPVHLFIEDNHSQSVAAMTTYDVLLTNPVMDGMNLVSKEGPAVNERDGVLVLSREAGSYQQMSNGAIGIDPIDIEDTADALYKAVTISEAERKSQSDALRSAIAQDDPNEWLNSHLNDLVYLR